VLYIGQDADEICDLVSPHIGTIDIAYCQDVATALQVARGRAHDVVIIDQRDESLATRLIVPLIADIGYPVKLVVISPFSNVGHYLKVPGVARVLTAPVRESQLVKVLGLDPNKRRHDKIKLATEPKIEASVPLKHKTFVQHVSDKGMALISTAYKRTAFVMLGVLFLAFTFYGFMIGFFLISSGWAAPQTLTAGNVLVDRVQKDLGDLRLGLNLNQQRISEASQQAAEATRAEEEAALLVSFAADTVEKEIVSRNRQIKVIDQNLFRTEKVRKIFAKQLKAGGMSDDLARLYGKRLIDRKSYSSNTLGLLEAGQRMAGIESQVDIMRSDRAQLEMQVLMLRSLKSQLQKDGEMSSITAASADLLLLTKQALDARAAFDTAKAQFAVSKKTEETLRNSQHVLETQIAKFENSTLGRAISQRVDVLFVPYSNAAQFQTGAALYSCKFTMVYCWKAGTVGQILPGEIDSVHPFFGKPIRGFFVEAHLTDTDAATHEIIHAKRPPFFF
jgi:hypothetical protein